MTGPQSCPAERELQSILDGTLSQPDEAVISDHLSDCDRCQQRLEALAGTVPLLEHINDQSDSIHTTLGPQFHQTKRRLHDSSPGLYGNTFKQPQSSGSTPPAKGLTGNNPAKDTRLTHLGPYPISGIIGRGGMGVVYKATDPTLKRPVAIKVIAAELSIKQNMRRRFLREARVAAAINHPHVVTIYHVGVHSRQPYLVMEYIDGSSLQEQLKGSRKFSPKELVHIALQTASGLAAAHAQGVTHLDIKPGNILLTSEKDWIKITDFGLARATDDVNITQTGILAGTPAYMAPEQTRGDPVDHRADLYSMGSVLYAMATGQPPFESTSTLKLIHAISNTRPANVRELNPNIPDWLETIILRLHEPNPDDRFQTAKEVIQALKKQTSFARSKRSSSSRRSPSKKIFSYPDALPNIQIDSSRTDRSVPTSKKRNLWKYSLTAGIALLCIAGTITQFSIFTTSNSQDNPRVQNIYLRTSSHIRTSRAEQTLDSERPFVIRSQRPDTDEDQLAATLEDAIYRAQDGDIISIQNSGPFICPPIRIRNKAITLVAATGTRPRIQLQSTYVEQSAPLIWSDSPLILEGIDLEWNASQATSLKPATKCIVIVDRGTFFAANCRFFISNGTAGISLRNVPKTVLRNCEIHSGSGNGIVLSGNIKRSLRITNGIHSGRTTLALPYRRGGVPPTSVRIKDCTMINANFLALRVLRPVPRNALNPIRINKPLRIETTTSVLRCSDAIITLAMGREFPISRQPQRNSILTRVLKWNEYRNLYDSGGPFVSLRQLGKSESRPAPWSPQSLDDWNHFWNLNNTGSQHRPIEFEQANLTRSIAGMTQPIPTSYFRIRFDNSGRRPTSFVKPFGARIDRVGPGPAYDLWKQTPEYHNWLDPRDY